MERNKEETKKKIFDATGKLIAKNGFHALGINAVAREAGVDKVLIYRYFGKLPDLLKAFMDEGNFWPDPEDFVTDCDKTNLRETAFAIFSGYASFLRKNSISREIFRWEIIERNEFTEMIAAARESQGVKLTETIKKTLGLSGEKAIAVDSVSAIIISGLYYLVLRSKTVDMFSGVDISSDSGWEEINKGLKFMIDAFFDKLEAKI